MTRPSARPSAPQARDDGAIIVGWLVKLVVVLSLIGVAAFDAIGVGVAHLRVSDDANRIAAETRDSLYLPTRTQAMAFSGAQRLATTMGYTLAPQDVVIRDGVVTVHLQTTASTILLQRLPLTRHWAVAEAVATAVAQKPSGH